MSKQPRTMTQTLYERIIIKYSTVRGISTAAAAREEPEAEAEAEDKELKGIDVARNLAVF